jgi:hypothetical protein
MSLPAEPLLEVRFLFPHLAAVTYIYARKETAKFERKTMRAILTKITVACCLIGAATLANAQARKPGLWEITTNMTWQQSPPLPPGMAAGGHSPFGGGVHTTQACITQEQIDKYGGLTQQGRRDCQITNVSKKSDSFSAELVCSGSFSGKGDIQATWTDDEHASSKTHFLGSIQMGPNAQPIEWSSQSTSVFKSADCGSVKPIQVPDK